MEDSGYVEVNVKISMEKRDGETDKDAYERLYDTLVYNLCNNSEHVISFQYI